MLELDADNKQIWQLSNDAFYLLLLDEEPLDENNIEEANELAAMFPLGFAFGEYEFIEDGLVEAEFIPYKESAFRVDQWCKVTNDIALQVQYSENKKSLKYRFYHYEKGTIMEGEAEVLINQFNKSYFLTTGGSIFPLWTSYWER